MLICWRSYVPLQPLGLRLPPGVGIAGSVVSAGDGVAVSDCRNDPRFAAQIAAGTGYVPNTMLVVPLKAHSGKTLGVISILDRRDGGHYTQADVTRAEAFAELAMHALELDPESLGDFDGRSTAPGT